VVAALAAGGVILAVGDDDASPKMDKQQMLQLGDTCTAAVRRQLHPREVELTERTSSMTSAPAATGSLER
jgi:hypothetical protein